MNVLLLLVTSVCVVSREFAVGLWQMRTAAGRMALQQTEALAVDAWQALITLAIAFLDSDFRFNTFHLHFNPGLRYLLFTICGLRMLTSSSV
jgi:hypothetical protein